MVYCELHETFKQDTDTCFDYDKDELLLGFNPNDIIEQMCKNCGNREVN